MDKKIKAIIRQWKYEAHATSAIQFNYRRNTLTIYTYQVGHMVGRGGSIADKFRQILINEGIDVEEIIFVEVSRFTI